MSKYCPYCHCSTNVVKIGVTSAGRQRYKCKVCLHTWSNKVRSKRRNTKVWNDYAIADLRIWQLSIKYNLSQDTIRSIINQYEVPPIVAPLNYSAKVIAMDATYFSRNWGLLIVIDVHNGNCLYCEAINGYETIMDYQRAIIYLTRERHIHPQVCIVDGKKGMYKMLEYYHIKAQLCQFHQIQTVHKYLTRNPILEPNIELRRIALSLTHSNYKTFYTMLNSWYLRNLSWIKEKTYNPDTKRREYTHKDTRKAARSLLTNLPYLFTYQDPDLVKLAIPNTNNMLEGINSAIKHKLNHHRGARKELKIKIVRTFLSNRTGV